MKMDAAGCDMCATNALASFHGKIKEAITLVRSMSTENKLKAVQYWNAVSENLQDVVNSSADDISALQSRLCERESMMLLLNPRTHPSGSLSRHQLPRSQGFTVIRRTEPNTIGGPDLGHKQQSAPVIGPDTIHHYLEGQPPAAATGSGHLTVPVMVEEYGNFNSCEVLDDPLAEDAASADLRNDSLGAEETLAAGEGQPISRDTDPLPDPPNIGARCEHNRVREIDDATLTTSHENGAKNDGKKEADEHAELSESADFQRYLNFAKNETGAVVLNFFTRQPRSSDCKENEGAAFRCNVCQEPYSSLAAFYAHFAAHCERLVCCRCGQTCHSKTLFRAHMLTHSKSLLKCIECGRVFTTFSNLSRHMKIHTGERRFECSVCNKRFAERKDLRTHSRLHSGERPYQCSQCPARFVQLGALSAHLRHHNGERPHLCDLCGKTFAQMATLRDHKLRHEGKKRFPCERCPMAFNVRSDLKRHRRCHLAEKPHKCSQCSKSFPRPQALAEHINRHLGNRPYRCTFCTKGYADRSACRKHMKTHARGESRLQRPLSPAAGPDSSPVVPRAADNGA